MRSIGFNIVVRIMKTSLDDLIHDMKSAYNFQVQSALIFHRARRGVLGLTPVGHHRFETLHLGGPDRKPANISIS